VLSDTQEGAYTKILNTSSISRLRSYRATVIRQWRRPNYSGCGGFGSYTFQHLQHLTIHIRF